MPTSQDNLQKLYNNASQHYDLPDFNTFKQDMSNPDNREKFRQSVAKYYDVPDSATFSSDLGFSSEIPTITLPGQSKEQPQGIPFVGNGEEQGLPAPNAPRPKMSIVPLKDKPIPHAADPQYDQIKAGLYDLVVMHNNKSLEGLGIQPQYVPELKNGKYEKPAKIVDEVNLDDPNYLKTLATNVNAKYPQYDTKDVLSYLTGLTGNRKEIRTDIGKIQQKPTSESYADLADRAINIGDLGKSMNLYQKAAQLDPNNDRALNGLAYGTMKTGNELVAKDMYEGLIQSMTQKKQQGQPIDNSIYVNALQNYAYLEAQHGDLEKTKAIIGQIQGKDETQDDPSVLRLKSIVAAKEGDVEKYTDYLNKAVESSNINTIGGNEVPTGESLGQKVLSAKEIAQNEYLKTLGDFSEAAQMLVDDAAKVILPEYAAAKAIAGFVGSGYEQYKNVQKELNKDKPDSQVIATSGIALGLDAFFAITSVFSKGGEAFKHTGKFFQGMAAADLGMKAGDTILPSQYMQPLHELQTAFFSPATALKTGEVDDKALENITGLADTLGGILLFGAATSGIEGKEAAPVEEVVDKIKNNIPLTKEDVDLINEKVSEVTPQTVADAKLAVLNSDKLPETVKEASGMITDAQKAVYESKSPKLPTEEQPLSPIVEFSGEEVEGKTKQINDEKSALADIWEGVYDENVISYEDATKITPTSELSNPEKYGTDELGMEAKTAALRDEEKTPPKFNEYKIGTYAKDRFGDLYQLQNVPIDKIVLPEGENKRETTVNKYKEWYNKGSKFPPAKGVENFAEYGGKVVINDGHHRIVAAKQLGLKEAPVWVSLTDPKNPARPIKDIEYHKSILDEQTKKESKTEPTSPITDLITSYEKLKDRNIAPEERRKINNERKELLDKHPTIKHIFDNIADIHKQLGEQITKRGDCP
jgi:tetratricopeptide (TPR) repeat protein